MVTIICGGQKFQEIELIGFDKDGTLLDFDMYAPVMQKRAEVLVEKYKLPEKAYNDILDIMGVDPNTNVVIKGGPIHVERIKNIKRTIEYLRNYSITASVGEMSHLFDEVDDQVDFSAHIKPYSGVKELLEKLEKTDVKIVLFTLDSTKPAKKHLKSAGIKESFDLILGVDVDSPYQPKPAPDMLQYACKLLEVNVNKSIVIGDDNKDMLLGKNAGSLGCIGVLSGKSEEKELIDADIIIASVADIEVK
jgi:phosphoglycolate phosphatase